jgi:hypothetical protein
MKLRYNTDQVPSFEVLCQQFAGMQLQSPYRSTVPLLNLLGHKQSDWYKLLHLLAVPEDACHHFEYCVPSPKPGGNPSQTDVMLISNTGVWAIEAKWTEPRYETVAQRIERGEDDGADPTITIEGWIDHLRPYSSKELLAGHFKEVVYQMLHRAASACAVAKEKGLQPALVYLHFTPSPLATTATTAQYENDLAHLHSLLGSPKGFPFHLIELSLVPTPSFEVRKDLNKRDPATAVKVLEALQSCPLFNYGAAFLRSI